VTGRPLQESSTGDLLALSRRILTELKRRKVIRTGNAPAGDYAELLVRQATGGELAPNAQRSWDVLAPNGKRGERLQVKARLVTNPGAGASANFRSFAPGTSTQP